MRLNKEVPCGARFEDNICQLPAGHGNKHRCEAVTWSDAGVARAAAEKKNKEEIGVRASF
jgi:hypothetical protein